jgi:hypothetical protein
LLHGKCLHGVWGEIPLSGPYFSIGCTPLT